jgi:predicted ATP-dependent protease
LAFDRTAVARLIDYGSRLCEHRHKLSARLLQIGDLVKEADFWARHQGAELVSAAHVDRAVDKKIYRSNLVEQKLDELIEEGSLIIDTEGSQVGQVNGLSIMQMGDYSFGRPSRITARTHIGKGHILNIERETQMSGNIHSKGVLILSGFLGSRYAQDKPLALAASICFEQLYDGVEGDSASSAELYVLLSSIGSIPLRQDLAVTGSVDQRGVVQPVGGVNQKIEGFFQVCKRRGLSGKQGVLIPQLNMNNLLLRQEVVDAVGQGLFHIYPVVSIDQGMEILCGLTMGERDSAGRYPQGTVNGAVDQTLRDYSEALVRLEKRSTNQP